MTPRPRLPLLVLLLLFLPSLLTSCASVPIRHAGVVAIDPGHPSETSQGASGPGGATEIEVNWAVAEQVKDLLQERGYVVVLTKLVREELVTNRHRAEIGSYLGADVMVRLHCDAGSHRGTATYYPDRQGTRWGVTGPEPEVIAGSRALAELFHPAMSRALGPEWLGLSRRGSKPTSWEGEGQGNPPSSSREKTSPPWDPGDGTRVFRAMNQSKPNSGPTGIVLLNMGGPKTLDDVGPFLLELFEDREIIQLPFQGFLGPFIAKRRTSGVKKLYKDIGGGSPILQWTNVQGEGMVERLDRLSPETAPHKFYVAFRYVEPFSKDALKQMKADGVKRAIAFTQYQHFSCATTGSSLNELWRAAGTLGMAKEFEWSVIDRWPTHPGFIRAMAKTVRDGLEQFPAEERDDVLLLFSAHSLPLSIIDRGDPYPQEVGASVHEVLKEGGFKNEFLLSYQSEVGPVRWLGPSTERVIKDLGAKGRKKVLVVGIAFTSDHIETLSEIDIEYGHLAKTVGITEFKRAPAFNGEPLFQDALAQIALDHMRSGEACSSQFGFRCPGCTNPECRNILNPVAPFNRTPVRAP